MFNVTNKLRAAEVIEPSIDRQPVLVFPATHLAGRDFIEVAIERGESVIAASSVWDAEFDAELGTPLRLPHVHEPEFAKQFLDLIKERRVGSVYAPVAAVYSWLDTFIRRNNIPIRLIGGSPIKREMGRYQKLVGKAKSYRSFIDVCADGDDHLSSLEVASIFGMASTIYGESNDQKIAAMMAIFSTAPKGDVIEIGSLVGKSAAVLAFLARRYQIGNVLAIDPWLAGPATQHDSPSTVRVDMVNEWDYEILPEDFTINLLPIGLGILNYIRRESVKGFEMYRACPEVSSPIFGTVCYRGQASVIHIDGNHDYAQVKQDCELWLQILAPDGWLILDDYLWAHGDGPYRVGNTLLVDYAEQIERSFTCGKALFIKFSAFRFSGFN
jgi:hypothetical protein